MIRNIITSTLLSLSVLSYAQIPVNNTCVTATTLTYNGVCVNGTNTGANVNFGDGTLITSHTSADTALLQEIALVFLQKLAVQTMVQKLTLQV